MDKKKKLIIIGIIALVLVIVGTTYAILTWTSNKINIGLNKKGIDHNKENIKSGGTEGYMNRLIIKLCYSMLFIAIGYLLGVSHMFLKLI